MIEIRKTKIFTKWFDNLNDRRARARIQVRIDRMERGNFGDVSPVGEGISEMRIFYGPGYRVFFVQVEKTVVVLLSGGDKSTQNEDIIKTKKLAQQVEV
ncbi:MAG: type II toxin-antitoxin system RelE/ParE family toxin [Desulfocapsa sp.]|nr:type II toxin-antitoxin system RelE/ParE family toxin [Desulfocapsa sp.]